MTDNRVQVVDGLDLAGHTSERNFFDEQILENDE